MLYPTLSSLVEKANGACRYSLVLAVAKRARAISGEMGESQSEVVAEYKKVCNKPVSVAIQEIAEGKVEVIE
ncbi:MAG: DNA-directed RNA polymerase subunit omega [Clostridia bacterium]|nr:DNA-directed RNA polymerase subunit omega [Clostridia bacterium]